MRRKGILGQPPSNYGRNWYYWIQTKTELIILEERMESIKIKGMSCQHCVGSVKKALENISGLSQVSVNLDKSEATFNNENVSREKIREAISKIGFEPGE
jgi:copper chaperone